MPHPLNGWPLTLMETGLGSWADEMEDMPIPCEYIRSKRVPTRARGPWQVARISINLTLQVNERSTNIIYITASGSRTTYGSEKRNFSSTGGIGNEFTGQSEDLNCMLGQMKSTNRL